MSNVHSRRKQNNGALEMWIQFGLLTALAVLIWVISKKFAIGYFLEKLETNAVLSVIIPAIICTIFMTNALYAFAYTRIAVLIDGEPRRFLTNLLPIWTDFNLKSFYETNECEGSLPIVLICISVLKTIVFWGGALFIKFKYGFLYFYDPHAYWLIGSFIVYILYIIFKSIVMGVILASYRDYLPTSIPGFYYIKHILYLSLLLIYFLGFGPLSAFLKFSIPVLTPRVMNIITILAPFVIPPIVVWDSIQVHKQVERKLNSDEEDEDEDFYED